MATPSEGQTSSTTHQGGAEALPSEQELIGTLISANHILHHHNVVDAYGHISVRNPANPSTFFISRDRAPALVSKRSDIEEYHISDASPVNPNSAKGYLERYIHSEIYKRYPGVHSVVHAHAEVVLPFSIGSVPLRPVYHGAAVMGAKVPVFDIAKHYRASDTSHSMLVTNEHLGAGLAAGFQPESMLDRTTNAIRNLVTASSSAAKAVDFPPSPTVLMRGHGFTCVGMSIEEAVVRAMYTCSNARIQTTALLMQGSFNIGLVGERFGGGDKAPGPAKYEDITYLSERETADCRARMTGTNKRPWNLWNAEVREVPLYSNELADPPY